MGNNNNNQEKVITHLEKIDETGLSDYKLLLAQSINKGVEEVANMHLASVTGSNFDYSILKVIKHDLESVNNAIITVRNAINGEVEINDLNRYKDEIVVFLRRIRDTIETEVRKRMEQVKKKAELLKFLDEGKNEPQVQHVQLEEDEEKIAETIELAAKHPELYMEMLKENIPEVKTLKDIRQEAWKKKTLKEKFDYVEKRVAPFVKGVAGLALFAGSVLGMGAVNFHRDVMKRSNNIPEGGILQNWNPTY